MRIKTLRRIRNSLLLFIVTVVCIEAGLRLVDPIGWYKTAYDWRVLAENTVARDGYYVMRDGYYDLHYYDVTIADQLRVTPDNGSGCRVVALGDSFTFAMGVDDQYSWVNLAAQETGYEWINTGMPGLQATNLLAVKRDYPADVYVYLNTQNDAQTQAEKPNPAPEMLFSASNLYFFKLVYPDLIYNLDEYERVMPDLLSGDVIWYSFDIHPQLEYNIEHGAILLSNNMERFGRRDGHASVNGNQQIYNEMRPTLLPYLAQHCQTP
jgi:hypothetical protein